MIDNDPKRERVLVAPLHWGLGHAARCIPLIQEQLDLGLEVVVAASGGPLALLKEHFPSLRFVALPFKTITYPADGNMVRHFTWHGLGLMASIWKEHRKLQRLVRSESIDLVISDSRFGLWSRHCRCVFVSHQIKIMSPRFEGLINRLNRWVMNQYDEVWIPDHAQSPGLAGELSHPDKMPKHYRYIGPLSRFAGKPESKSGDSWKVVAVISGPEPQRSIFEAEVARRLIEGGERALILEGKPDDPKESYIDQLTVVHHLDDNRLAEALVSADLVIARSGYSTIMDLNALGVQNVEYHPTPGQTEQEYLAQLHASKGQN
ncbi:MAG: hypothetical protein HQ500_00475 [Flavobacteriales bacterium]|nr:hypothetical protein [Flavobacteriales bacterium]